MKGVMRRVRSSKLATNAVWLLGGNGLRLCIQAAYFVVIARGLGPEQYGAFVAVVAIAAILSPFVGVGTGNLIVRNVAHDEELFPTSWGNSLLVTFASGILALSLVCVCRFVLPANIKWVVLLLVATADLIFLRMTDLCGFAFGALERFSVTAQINVWSSLTRLIGVALLVIVAKSPSVEQWAATYLIATVLTAVASLIVAFRILGRPALAIGRIWSELKEGFYFSVGQSAQTIYNDLDKTMLARLGDLTATGIYGAAYRIIDVSVVPLRSVLSASYPGFFRAGKDGMSGSIRYMWRLFPKAFVFSFVIFIGLLIGASAIPHILGKDYDQAVSALRWLALLPVLKTIHFLLADSLTGAGFQGFRTLIQAGAAVFNILINLWLIPAYSWRGAAWSSLASDGLLALMFMLAAVWLLRSQQKAVPLVAAEIRN